MGGTRDRNCPGLPTPAIEGPLSADSRPTPIQQVLRCERLLREGWHTKEALAQRLDVTLRTIKRYLSALEEEEPGLEVREVDERGRREYRIRDPRLVDRRSGSPYEVLALAVAERFFRAFDPGGVADLLDQMLYEITGEDADDEDFELVDRSRRGLGRRFALARRPQPLLGDVRLVFDQLLRALVDRKVVELRYEPRRGGARDYVLRPYTLLLGEAELAIIGAVGEPPENGTASPKDPIRTFALHRIRGITLRSQGFAMPNLAQWDPEARFAGSWGLYAGEAEPVTLAVHPAFSELVARRRWHPSQRSEVAEDGWIRLQFEVFTGGEFRTWLLGWGPWLRVESPSALADWVESMRSAAPGEGTPDDEEVFRIV